MKKISSLERRYPKSKILKVWKENISIKQLSKILKINNNSLKYLLIQYGLIKFDPLEKYKHITKKTLESEYKVLGIHGLSKKYHLHKITVKLLLEHYKIKPKIQYHYINEDFFKSITQETLYVAGFIAADGCINKPKKSKQAKILSITTAKDKALLKKIKILLEYSGKIYKYKRSNDKYRYYVLSICSTIMCNDLIKFGISERKSLTYKMPDWLMQHPFVNYFLLGYFDGDGTIWIGKNRRIRKGRKSKEIKYGLSICGTEDFLNQFQLLLNINNIINYKNKLIKDGKNKLISKVCYGGRRLCIKLYEFLNQNSPIYLERKYNKYLLMLNKNDKCSNII